MNNIKNDQNLREAVSRREQQLSPIPDNLNDEVMKRLMEPETAPKSRRLWVYAAIAAAASIAMLIVFNAGKEQNPQEPFVAQQTVKQAVAPSQPTAEEPHPEVVSDELSEEKPVTEPSKDAPQTTEPIATEKAEAPRHSNFHPFQDVTSPKDEPFFLASTSYMVAHRSNNDGFDAESTESENGSLTLLSTKMTAQNRPPVPSAKDKYSKLTKKERKRLAVLDAIATKRWHVDITSMNTLRYGARVVTPDFFLELRGDTLRSYLPYLGQVQVSTMSTSISLNFEEPVLSYKESKPKSNKYTQLDIDVKTREDSYHYVIEVYDNGQAYIRVRSMNRDPISFDGTMEIE